MQIATPSSARPDFTQPIAALKHCHDRIRKELQALEALPAHLSQRGVDLEAQRCAAAIVRYFDEAAPVHHADEEEDLIPLLQASARDADAALLGLMIPMLMTEHHDMAVTWDVLQMQLKQIALAESSELDLGLVQQFSLLYAAHMDTEETHIAAMAKRLFDPAKMELLGNAMRRRRGLPVGDGDTAVKG